MCTTCGCHSGEHSIEGDQHHPHSLFRAAPFSSVPRPARKITGIMPTAQKPPVTQTSGEAGIDRERRIVELEIDVLDKNNQLAQDNRALFARLQQLVLNLVSSPGSGKTTLLCETLHRLQGKIPCAVIEGDQQTSNDADRIRATHTPAIQINTGTGCHLDAQMVREACARLPLTDPGILFIENVGNLVCPASFDLGEQHKVVVLSVTEGEDKPLKYPHMFAAASLMILNKIDLLPYVQFDLQRCMEYARQVNPHIEILCLSATKGEGMEQWLNWLEQQRCV
ncbi:MAG: hydrogenase nickel incorporation protein HypB [Enterobacteriaceae bacterium]